MYLSNFIVFLSSGGRLHFDAGHLRGTQESERFDWIVEQRAAVQPGPRDDTSLCQAHVAYRIRP